MRQGPRCSAQAIYELYHLRLEFRRISVVQFARQHFFLLRVRHYTALPWALLSIADNRVSMYL
jgi:hypothetical protein